MRGIHQWLVDSSHNWASNVESVSISWCHNDLFFRCNLKHFQESLNQVVITNLLLVLFKYQRFPKKPEFHRELTHWGQVMHLCVSKLIITGSDNDLSPGQHQAIIWTNAEILSLWTNFSKILIEIHMFSFKKMHLKLSLGNCGHFVSASIC